MDYDRLYVLCQLSASVSGNLIKDATDRNWETF